MSKGAGLLTLKERSLEQSVGQGKRWPHSPLPSLPASEGELLELDTLKQVENHKKPKHRKATQHHWDLGKENHSHEMQLLSCLHQSGTHASEQHVTGAELQVCRAWSWRTPTHSLKGPHAQNTLLQGGTALPGESDAREAK